MVSHWVILAKVLTDFQTPVGTPEKQIKQEAKASFEKFLNDRMQEYGELTKPFLANTETSSFIKDYLKTTVILSDDVAGEGFLVGNKEYKVLLRNQNNIHRVRFNLAHELGHIFLHDSTFEKKSEALFHDNDLDNIEGIASEIARMLLMPRFSLPKTLDENIDINTINELIQDYNVSDYVLAPRIFYDLRCWKKSMFFICPRFPDIPEAKDKERYYGFNVKRKINFSRSWDVIKKHLFQNLSIARNGSFDDFTANEDVIIFLNNGNKINAKLSSFVNPKTNYCKGILIL